MYFHHTNTVVGDTSRKVPRFIFTYPIIKLINSWLQLLSQCKDSFLDICANYSYTNV